MTSGLPGDASSSIRVPDGNVWWHRIATSPWCDEFFASADAIYNIPGMTTGSLRGTRYVDEASRHC